MGPGRFDHIGCVGESLRFHLSSSSQRASVRFLASVPRHGHVCESIDSHIRINSHEERPETGFPSVWQQLLGPGPAGP
jgi:hypothetical protein